MLQEAELLFGERRIWKYFTLWVWLDYLILFLLWVKTTIIATFYYKDQNIVVQENQTRPLLIWTVLNSNTGQRPEFESGPAAVFESRVWNMTGLLNDEYNLTFSGIAVLWVRDVLKNCWTSNMLHPHLVSCWAQFQCCWLRGGEGGRCDPDVPHLIETRAWPLKKHELSHIVVQPKHWSASAFFF